MPSIRSVRDGTHEGEKGFVVEWEMIGFVEEVAKFRAVGMTAMRFPTTITEAEIVGIREFNNRDFNIQVFIPTEGFLSAGIKNPVDWFRDQFGGDQLDI